MSRPARVKPLPPSVLHILLALGDDEQHGYLLMRRVEDLTDGAVSMGPGTLYGSIKRMLADGLIEETAERPDPELDDERRRYYRVTADGARRRADELARMESLLRRAASPRFGEARDEQRPDLPRAPPSVPTELPSRLRRPHGAAVRGSAAPRRRASCLGLCVRDLTISTPPVLGDDHERFTTDQARDRGSRHQRGRDLLPARRRRDPRTRVAAPRRVAALRDPMHAGTGS